MYAGRREGEGRVNPCPPVLVICLTCITATAAAAAPTAAAATAAAAAGSDTMIASHHT